MSSHKKHFTRADSDLPAVAAKAIPVQTTFRHMTSSPAVVAHIHAEVQKLRRYFVPISHCHAVVSAPPQHHLHGGPYAVRLELGVPGGPLIVNHEPVAKPGSTPEKPAGKSDEFAAPRKDIYVVLRDAFDVARRQLEDSVRRKRDDVKRPHVTVDVDTPAL